MPPVRYLLLTFAGSTLWCLAFADAGFALGSSWERFDNGFRYVEIAIVALAAAGVAWLVLKRRSNRLANRV